MQKVTGAKPSNPLCSLPYSQLNALMNLFDWNPPTSISSGCRKSASRLQMGNERIHSNAVLFHFIYDHPPPLSCLFLPTQLISSICSLQSFVVVSMCVLYCVPFMAWYRRVLRLITCAAEEGSAKKNVTIIPEFPMISLLSRKTNHVPVSPPIRWISLFRSVCPAIFSFLLFSPPQTFVDHFTDQKEQRQMKFFTSNDKADNQPKEKMAMARWVPPVSIFPSLSLAPALLTLFSKTFLSSVQFSRFVSMIYNNER